MSRYNDLNEDTTQKMGSDYLAVKTGSWHLIKAFKEACEEMGWKYNHRFTAFTQEKYDKMNEGKHRCLYFSFDFDDMEGQPAFALSCTTLPSYTLPVQWNEALASAKKMLDANRHLYSVELNEDYTAVVDTKKRTVRVGCQEFPFDKIEQLVNIVNKSK